MKTKVSRIKGQGVAASKTFLEDGDTFILGQKPNHEETMADDFVKVKECRFIVKGATFTENKFNSYELDENSPIPEKGNPNWAKVTAIGETIGFCMSTNNPKHRVLEPYRFRLKANETLTLEQGRSGFITPAHGTMTINDTDIAEMELVKLTGANAVQIKAGPDGADVGFLEIEFLP